MSVLETYAATTTMQRNAMLQLRLFAENSDTSAFRGQKPFETKYF